MNTTRFYGALDRVNLRQSMIRRIWWKDFETFCRLDQRLVKRTLTRLSQPTRSTMADGSNRSPPASAMTALQSNGQTESQHKRLNLLKRPEYGLAEVDLLRKRVILVA